ncbi:hypothetical protein OROGR_031860 [Orobanche gracilis]
MIVFVFLGRDYLKVKTSSCTIVKHGASWSNTTGLHLDKNGERADPEKSIPDLKPNVNDSQTEQPNNATETPIPDSGSVSVSSNDNRKVSREDIELVQNLIERCLQLYMNRNEVVKILVNRAGIDPGFTRGGSVRYTENFRPYRISYRNFRYDKNHTVTIPKFSVYRKIGIPKISV